VTLDVSEKVNFSRPSIDVAFESAAEVFREQLVAVLLSGANTDGVEGLSWVRKLGGRTLVQDPATASVDYMPQSAIQAGVADEVLSPSGLLDIINSL
ncbi:MAG TPA: chemotaxis protein CheB, partial [Flavipsychrobacter sp.]|nr:chemotaxis protein CheB [Flavipsychrobacter sp.]